MWISPTISSARHHWQDLLIMIEESGLPVRSINKQSHEIHFHGGGFLSIRSAIEPDNIRGDSLDYIILDEAAFYRNGKYVWEAVCLPMITTSRGIMLMTTTPNGRNWVYDLYLEGQKEDSDLYKSWRMSSIDSPIQDVKTLRMIEKTMTKKRWREEFMAEFLADGGGVFSGVNAAATQEPINRPEAGHTYVAGIDITDSNDLCAFTVVDKYERKQVYGKVLDGVGTVNTVKELIKLIEHWQPEKTYIEKNGVGVLGKIIKAILNGRVDEGILETLDFDPTEDGQLLEDEYRLKLVHMDNTKKREAVERLATDIEYGRLEILTDNSTYGFTQMNEMSVYEAKRTRSGLNVTYGAEEGYHDDTISALYLAYMGVPRPKPFKKHWKNKGKKNPFKRRTTAPRSHRTGGRRLRHA